MKTTKKLLSLLLSLAMILSLCVAVSADDSAPAPGHYALSGVTEGDETYDSDIVAMLAEAFYLDLNEDGTFVFVANEQESTGTWDASGLTIDGELQSFTYDGTTITLAEDDMSLSFTLGDAPAADDASGDAAEGDDTAETTEDPELGDPEILEDTVVLDDDYMTITITGIEHDSFGYYDISYTAVNKTDKAVTASSKFGYVNDIQLDSVSCYVSLDAGAKKKDSFSIYESYLGGIKYIGKIAWRFEVYDAENYDVLDDMIYGEVTTSLDGQFIQDINTDGDVLLDDDYCKVVYQGARTNEYGYRYIDFYVENKTEDKYIYISKDELSYDGWQADDYLSVDLCAGTCGYTSMTMYGEPEDFDVESLDDLKEMKISIKAIDYDTWETLSEGEAVTVSLETASPRA